MTHYDDNTNDATLVAQVRAGERALFEPLAQRHYASVLRLCARLLGSPFEAQDVAQEALLQSFLGLARLQEPARFGAWLHAIAANLCRMALRRRHAVSLDALGDGVALLLRWPAPPTPEEISAARATHDAVVAALAELSAVNREVVIRFYVQGYSYAELAELLGVPISTVKGRLHKGRRQLRTSLAPLAPHGLAVRGQGSRTRAAPKHSKGKGLIMEPSDLVAMKVDHIRAAGEHSDNRILVLRQPMSGRVLAIYIGAFEADAIALALQGEQPQRPLTHDLTLRLLATLGAQVERVVVSRLHDATFYAEVALTQGAQRLTVDARPSDAIALAVRCNAPVLVARAVYAAAGGEDNTAFWDALAETSRRAVP